MVIEGHSLAQRLLAKGAEMEGGSSGRSDGCGLLKGGSYTSHHDHRMVMALKVAQLGADGPIVIDDVECVAKSFPQFHDTFERLVVR